VEMRTNRSCWPAPYRRSLEVAVQNGLRSISFPSISTGAFVYPMRLAAPVAPKTIVDFLKQEKHDLDEVRMVLYTREDDKAYTVYATALEQLLGASCSPGSIDRAKLCSTVNVLTDRLAKRDYDGFCSFAFLGRKQKRAVSHQKTARPKLTIVTTIEHPSRAPLTQWGLHPKYSPITNLFFLRFGAAARPTDPSI